jgi:hypothetical protein
VSFHHTPAGISFKLAAPKPEMPLWLAAIVVAAFTIGGIIVTAASVVLTALAVYGLWDLGRFLLGG